MNKMDVELTLKDIVDFLYPIGSLYYTQDSSFNPNTHFGGTWVQIKDKFILACGDTYKINQTGGVATNKIVADNLPESFLCTYNNLANKIVTVGGIKWDYFQLSQGSWCATERGSANALGHEFKYTPLNNMPPYETAFIWKRTGE